MSPAQRAILKESLSSCSLREEGFNPAMYADDVGYAYNQISHLASPGKPIKLKRRKKNVQDIVPAEPRGIPGFISPAGMEESLRMGLRGRVGRAILREAMIFPKPTAKGLMDHLKETDWKKHKYTRKEGRRYVYPKISIPWLFSQPDLVIPGKGKNHHILITGLSGSGKTTDAEKYHPDAIRPVIHLDQFKDRELDKYIPKYLKSKIPHVLEGIQLTSWGKDPDAAGAEWRIKRTSFLRSLYNSFMRHRDHVKNRGVKSGWRLKQRVKHQLMFKRGLERMFEPKTKMRESNLKESLYSHYRLLRKVVKNPKVQTVAKVAAAAVTPGAIPALLLRKFILMRKKVK